MEPQRNLLPSVNIVGHSRHLVYSHQRETATLLHLRHGLFVVSYLHTMPSETPPSTLLQTSLSQCCPALGWLLFSFTELLHIFHIDKITLKYKPVTRCWPAFPMWLDTEVYITHDWLLLFKVAVSRSRRGSTRSFNYTFVQKWRLMFALEKLGS